MGLYTINQASKLSGLSAHCIRAWEKRYDAIRPQRLENGRRMYTETEIKRLVLLQKISSFGHSIGLIAHHTDDELLEMLEKMGGEVSQILPPNSVSPEEYLPRIIDALKKYDLATLTSELNQASENLSYRDFSLNVLAVLFRTAIDLNITQEHTLSALTKFFIGNRLARHYQSSSKRRPKILLAAPLGEYHSLGLLLSALLIAEYKFDLVYLGENLPEQSIAEAAIATESDIVLISIVMGEANQTLKKLRELIPHKKEIWVGGNLSKISSQEAKEIPNRTFSSLEQLDLWLQETTNLVSIK